MPGVPPVRFAYLGPEGTFTEAALRTLPAADQGVLLPQSSVPAAIDAVRCGHADAAVVPLENSVEGSVPTTVDELATGERLMITREIFLPITFALLTRAAVPYESIATVASHPHGEAQTRRWLRTHLPRAQVVLTASTAQAAEKVAEGEYDAAVAAPIAGEKYRLHVAADDIGDEHRAVTRFAVLSRPGPVGERTGNDRTSVVAFIADDHTGALDEVLNELAVRGINLTRIESRPTRERMGEYYFVLEFEGHLLDARVDEAMRALHRLCAEVRFLGSYPRADGPPKEVPGRAADEAFAAAAAWVLRLRDGGE